LLDWLGFFARQDWSALSTEYAALLQRQQHVGTALQLARLDSEQLKPGYPNRVRQPSGTC
jgi:hypothetical protein